MITVTRFVLQRSDSMYYMKRDKILGHVWTSNINNAKKFISRKGAELIERRVFPWKCRVLVHVFDIKYKNQ